MLLRVEEGAFPSRILAGGGAPAVRVRVLEVLRSMRALDAALQPHSRRDLRKLDAEVRVAMRIGLVEVMKLGLAPPLATDGAVRLVRRLGKSSASGMVNAVLRRAVSGWRELLASSAVDVRLSHPEWIFDRWSRNFGGESAEAAMSAAQEPAITWAWFFQEESRLRLVEGNVDLRAHPWCPEAWSAPKETGRLVAAVSDGLAYAQDPSSQLVAHVASALISRGGRVLDLCAAPGGKSALILRLGSADHVVAADLRLNRSRLMRSTIERAGHGAIVTADAAVAPFVAGSWDIVMLDAPCSGTGTFRRHPELKWRLRPDAIDSMAQKQHVLLAAGLQLLARGGVLLYTTCSVEPEENEGVVADLPDGFEIERLERYLPEGVPSIQTTAGGIRILPNPDGDGFTMHAMRRFT
jgi:16S rRNA (cytosine967-C5)-methyltransferase